MPAIEFDGHVTKTNKSEKHLHYWKYSKPKYSFPIKNTNTYTQ